MDKIYIIGIAVLIILILLFLIYYYFVPRTIIRSTPMGDFVPDKRNPSEVCKSMIPAIQARHPFLKVSLIEAKSVSPGEEEDIINKLCPDGFSIAGCFSCRFKLGYK